MPTEGKRPAQTNRRRFLGCAVGALGIAAAPTPKDAARKVPLDQVYAAADQSGLRRFPQKWEEKAVVSYLRGRCLAG